MLLAGLANVVQASVDGKKEQGLAVLLSVSRESRPRPICEWVADLFCEKTRGLRDC